MFSSGIKGTQRYTNCYTLHHSRFLFSKFNRCNGLVSSNSNSRPAKSKALSNSVKQKSSPVSQDVFLSRSCPQTYEYNSSFHVNTDKHHGIANGLHTVFKSESNDTDFEHHLPAHSIIGKLHAVFNN